MSNQPLPQDAPSSTRPIVDVARARLLSGGDYLASFPLQTASARRARQAPAQRDARAPFHALRGAVPK